MASPLRKIGRQLRWMFVYHPVIQTNLRSRQSFQDYHHHCCRYCLNRAVHLRQPLRHSDMCRPATSLKPSNKRHPRFHPSPSHCCDSFAYFYKGENDEMRVWTTGPARVSTERSGYLTTTFSSRNRQETCTEGQSRCRRFLGWCTSHSPASFHHNRSVAGSTHSSLPSIVSPSYA